MAKRRRGAAFSAPWRPTLRAVDTDVEMLARLRNGDEDAFVTLVGRYQQPMLRLARSFVPSQAVAEEAVQDTWLGLVRGIEKFEGRSSFKTWLFRILVNRARSAGTKEHPAAPTEALHAVDPARFTAEGQWVDPVDRWIEESEQRLDADGLIARLGAMAAQLPDAANEARRRADAEGLDAAIIDRLATRLIERADECRRALDGK